MYNYNFYIFKINDIISKRIVVGEFMAKRRIKKLLKLEKNLLNEVKLNDNKIFLSDDDFNNKGLSFEGYSSLKEQLDIIDILKRVEIIVPKGKKDIFETNIKRFVTYEIVAMKKKEKITYEISFFLMLLGILTIILYNLLSFEHIIYEIVVIASWVFAWDSVEKFFFELPAMRAERYKLLVLVDSNILEN